jgi:hypothetical protein
MKSELIKVNASDYGLEENKAKEIENAYAPMVVMLTEMEEQFNKVVSSEITKDLIPIAKRLRLDIGKVRINADKIRKSAKDEYLRAGNAIQGVYNTLLYAVKSKEDKLSEIESYFENIEKERREKLQNERVTELSKFIDESELAYVPSNICDIEESVWINYIAGAKLNFETKKEAEKQAELARIAAEKKEAERLRLEAIEQKRIKEENDRLKLEAERLEKVAEAERKANTEKLRKIEEENNRIRLENEAKAKVEADKIKAENERILAIEKANAAKLQAELAAKAEAEKLAIENAEKAKQTELSKGDAAKIQDLISDLENLKTKYSFKSVKNIKKMEQVNGLIEKVINYINQ